MIQHRERHTTIVSIPEITHIKNKINQHIKVMNLHRITRQVFSLLSLLAILMLSCILQSCSKDLELWEATQLETTFHGDQTYPYEGGTFTVDVKSNNNWKVDFPNYVQLDKTEGFGDATISGKVSNSTTSSTRGIYINVTAGNNPPSDNKAGVIFKSINVSQESECDHIKIKVDSLSLVNECTNKYEEYYDYDLKMNRRIYYYDYHIKLDYEITSDLSDSEFARLMIEPKADIGVEEYATIYWQYGSNYSTSDFRTRTLPVKKGKGTITIEATQTNYLWRADHVYVTLSWLTNDNTTRTDVSKYTTNATYK